MRGRSIGVAIVLGIGLAVIAAVILGRGATPEKGRAPASVTVVSAATPPPTASATLLPARAPNAAEAPADVAAIAAYRTIVSRALRLDAAAAYRGIVVADPQQKIVCGEVRSRANGAFRAFVFVGAAGIAALDDGSADLKGMQAGACGRVGG